MCEAMESQDKTYTYETEYGKLIVKTDGTNGEVVENTLDADAILGSEKAQNLTFAHGIWGDIIEELFGEDEISKMCPPDKETQFWKGELTDYGFRAIFASGLVFSLDHQGAYFDDCDVSEDDKTATYDEKRQEALGELTADVVALVLDAVSDSREVGGKPLDRERTLELQAAITGKIENYKPPLTWQCWTLSAEDIDMVYEQRLTGPELTEDEYEGIARYFKRAAEIDLGEMWQEYVEDAIRLLEGVEDKEDV